MTTTLKRRTTTTVKHTTVDRGERVIYQRRIPPILLPYYPLDIKAVKKSLGTISKGGNIKANRWEGAFNEALEVVQLGLSESEKISLIHNIFTPLLSNTKAEQKKRRFKDSITYTDLMEQYLSTLSVNRNTYKTYINILLTFKEFIGNKTLTKITSNDIDKYKKMVDTLPARTTQKVKSMELRKLIKTVAPIEEQLSIKSKNEYLKSVKTLFNFAESREILDRNPAKGIKLFKQTAVAREQRRALTPLEVNLLLESKGNTQLYRALKILAYTGMRQSELVKGQVVEIEGVLCFDLRTPTQPLKTLSSRRLIPLSDHLSREDFKSLEVPINLSKLGKQLIDKVLTHTEKASVYSLRHSFASNILLADTQNQVRAEYLSYLMGHSNGSSLTFNRYASFDVKELKKVIDVLHY